MIDEYVPYLGRMVPSAYFRTYVYPHNGIGDSLLVESYEEFKKSLSSKEWLEAPFNSKLGSEEAELVSQDAPKKKKKGALDADS